MASVVYLGATVRYKVGWMRCAQECEHRGEQKEHFVYSRETSKL